MPRPSLRTRSKKRHELRLPGGRTTTHYEKEKPTVPLCAQCGQVLSGIPRAVPSKLRKLPASRKKVQRIYGGQLCHNCLRDLLKQTVRST